MIEQDLNKELCPERLRNMGNEYYKKDEYVIAISCYTKSLARSPAGSRLRGLAYANRSAVLLSLGYYKESLADAQTALANDYPQELVFKLYRRMGICKKMIGMKSEAAKDFLLSIQKVDEDVALGIEKKKELKKEVMKQCMEERKHSPLPQVFAEYLKPPKLSYGANPMELKLSSAVVKLKDSTSLVAKHRIEVGDVVAVEDPLAYSTLYVVQHGLFGIHCSECFKMCLNLFPCTSCSWACYCSEECSKAAWEEYHETGCTAMENLLKKLSKDNIFNPTLFYAVIHAFICISAFGLENCIAAYNDQEISDIAPDVVKVKDFTNPNVYQNLNDSFTDIDMCEIVAESLQLTGGRKKSLISFLNYMFTKLIFTNHLRPIAQANVSCGGSRTLESCALRFAGFGYYQLLGPIDKSCDPNVFASFYLKTLVLRALRPIKKGEKLYMHNGTDFHFDELEERQQSLIVRRMDKCSCAACIEDWRTQPDQPLCRYTLLKNSTLVRRFLNTISFEGALRPAPMFAVSAVTTERYNDCVEILSRYGDRRRDDLLSLMVSNFLRIFFGTSAMRFTVEPPVGDCIDLRCLVPFLPIYLKDL